ncbi:hypothetical protein AB205_0210910 [Aquarana catesbeiana]|uniref:Uncharacterized protein n=1 Tax=Aquarana catesbeiana TaxID=8400 RepID=A0A2G9QEN5_AQUCT|nr:hypothetical protein AB205_0210910 [Aquarana catesbeiana]
MIRCQPMTAEHVTSTESSRLRKSAARSPVPTCAPCQCHLAVPTSATHQCPQCHASVPTVPLISAQSVTYQCHPSVLHISATYQCPSVSPTSAHQCRPSVVPISAHQCHPSVPPISATHQGPSVAISAALYVPISTTLSVPISAALNVPIRAHQCSLISAYQ